MDLEVLDAGDAVRHVIIDRPPNNFFDVFLLGRLADALEALAADTRCRAASFALTASIFVREPTSAQARSATSNTRACISTTTHCGFLW